MIEKILIICTAMTIGLLSYGCTDDRRASGSASADGASEDADDNDLPETDANNNNNSGADVGDEEEDSGDLAAPSVRCTSFDAMNDGTIDGLTRSKYDADGNFIYFEIVEDDGSLSYFADRRYDASGNRIFFGQDNDGDGEYNNTATYAYDEDGNTILEELDNDADGSPDVRYRYAYDADGNMTLVQIDIGADEVPEYEAESTYERGYIVRHLADGRVVDGQLRELADGTPDYIGSGRWDGQTYSYDEDLDGDGVVDFRHTYTFSGEDDSIVDYTQDGSYDRFGRVVVADGELDAAGRAEYDASGALASYVLDAQVDGTEDYTFRATYDADGHLLTSERDGEIVGFGHKILAVANGVPDETILQVWDGDDLIRREANLDEDLRLEFVYKTRFNDDGTPDTFMVDIQDNGVPTVTMAWTYDALGRMDYVDIDGWIDPRPYDFGDLTVVPRVDEERIQAGEVGYSFANDEVDRRIYYDFDCE